MGGGKCEGREKSMRARERTILKIRLDFTGGKLREKQQS